MTAPNQTTETIGVQGVAVPRLGFGTWLIESADATEAVRDALEIGYRQIDTARAYGNGAQVAEGIAQSGVPREEGDPQPRRIELPPPGCSPQRWSTRPCSATRSSTTRSWARTACSTSRANTTSS